MGKNIWRRSLHFHILRLFVIAGMVIGNFTPVGAIVSSGEISITPLTWNIVGLDSNNVFAGPNIFPVGARVCNSGDTAVYNVVSDFSWASSDSYIDLRANTENYYHQGVDLAVGECVDFYYEVEIVRNPAAYNHTRRYVITADANGGLSVSTPSPREIFVEHLVSQNRNTVSNIYLDGVSIPNGGTLSLSVGKTYDIQLVGSTSTNGYNQLESFINLPNTIFRINTVSSSYSVSNLSLPHKQLYADSCGWDSNPQSLTYRSCIVSDGKSGGTVTTTYNVTILKGAGTSQTLNTMLFDFSGSSYHYNSDFSSSSRIISIVQPFSFAKAFSPVSIPAGGVSTLTFTLKNTNSSAISGISFTDDLPSSPAQMTVANPANASTSGCGSPTFAPVAGSSSISFSGGTIAANSTCTISVKVTVPSSPATDTYTNTTGPVQIEGNDTGLVASANLTVSPASDPSLCTDIPMASWTFPAGTTVPNPAYTSKNADVDRAVASVSSGLTSNQSIDTTGSAAPNSWQARGGFGTSSTFNATTDQYFLFQVDTHRFTNVKLTFNFIRGSSGPVNLHVYYGNSATPPQNSKTSYSATQNWSESGEINFTGQTSTTGDTYFFLYGNYAANNGAQSTLNIDDVVFTGCQAPQSITKQFSPDVVAANGTSRLTFTLTNSRGTDYTGVSFTDALPSGLQVAGTPNPSLSNCGSPTLTADANSTSISFADGTIPASSVCTVGVDVVALSSGVFDNVTGFISSVEGGTNTGESGSGKATLTAAVPAAFSKRFTPNPVYAGEETSLIFTINNPNSVELPGVEFNDPLPGSLRIGTGSTSMTGCSNSTTPGLTAVPGGDTISFSGGSIAPGGTCTISVPVIAPAEGEFSNTSSALNTSIPGLSSDAATDLLVVKSQNPAIQLSKQISRNANGPWSSFLLVPPGTPLYYRLIIENTDDVSLYSVQVSDPLISLANCTEFTSPLTLTTENPSAACVVGPITAQDGDFINRASVEGNYDGMIFSASATAEYIGALVSSSQPSLRLIKQISTSPVGPWASSITNVVPGSPIYYRFTLINLSDVTISGLAIHDPPVSIDPLSVSYTTPSINPADCTFIDPLAPGNATVCLLGPASAIAGVHTNTANATSGSPAMTSSNSSATYSSGSLSISGIVWVDENGDNTVGDYESRFFNTSLKLYLDDGDSEFDPSLDTFLGSQYTDSTGEYSFGGLSTGDYFVVVDNGVTGYHLTYGVAPLFQSISDNSANNNFGYQPNSDPNLTVSKTNYTSDETSPVGEYFTWSLSVKNLGTGDATFTQNSVLLSDTLPGQADYDEITVSNPSIGCEINSGILNCSVTGSSLVIPAGGTLNVVSYRALPTAAGSLTNTVEVDPGHAVVETIENDNSSFDIVDAIAPPQISLEFSDASILLGNTSTLTFTLTNPNGSIGLDGVGFTAQLPAGLTVADATSTQCGGGTLTVTAPDMISFSGGSITGSGSCVFSLTVTGSTAGLKETSTDPVFSYNGGTGNSASGSITVVDPVSPVLLSVVKSHSGSFVRGSTGTYTIVVSNGAGAGATSGTVSVSDTLPAGMTLHATPGGDGWSCSGNPGEGEFTCERSDPLAASSSYAAITAVVDVGLNVASSVTNTATVFGGGDPASSNGVDPTLINSLPVANPDTNSAVKMGPPVSRTAETGLLANDNQGDAPAAVTAASQGSSTITLGTPFTTANGGILTLYADGSYQYTPPATGTIPPGGLVEVFNYTITDDNGDRSSSTLTITVISNSVTHSLYLPMIADPEFATVATTWDFVLGYEDLPLITGRNDYDYNDWTVEVLWKNYEYNSGSGALLKKLDLSFMPKTHGGTYSHKFMIQIPAGEFPSNGTAVLTIYNLNDQVISTQKMEFNSALANTYTIFSNTSNVLFEGANTVEGTGIFLAQQHASLSIEFSNPFALPAYQNAIQSPHGEGLFFDPVLKILETGDEVHRGDVRFLSVPTKTWKWPEESVRISKAYPSVIFTQADPPSITFPSLWWQNYNHCVYDGAACGSR